MQEYKFIKPDGSVIRADPLSWLWKWAAYFTDGTSLKQFGDDGFFHQFKEIDQGKLHVFDMSSDDGRKYSLAFNSETMKLIHFVRHTVLHDGQIHIPLYVFGYEQNINGSVYKTFMAIMPDGNLVLTNDIDGIQFVE